jgi:DNA-binding response OmpR family regulator
MNAGRHVVLVADDDEDVLLLVRAVLERAGHEVIVTRDGAEAVDVALRHRPDLAVLDVSMPELDGLEVLRRLRADATLAEIPVVLLSARVEEDDVKRGYESGANVYVQKPFSPRELSEQVSDLLAR